MRNTYFGLFSVGAISVALLVACDRPPSADGLKEWSASDHDIDPESAKAQLPKRGGGDGGGASGGGVASLVDLTWRAQCSQCHGEGGRGDGPTGPMLKATNFTDPEWQGRVQDGEIAAAILNGKGKMPKFDLSNELVAGLVARVRQLGGRGK